jgi:hypothetical protein
LLTTLEFKSASLPSSPRTTFFASASLFSKVLDSISHLQGTLAFFDVCVCDR